MNENYNKIFLELKRGLIIFDAVLIYEDDLVARFSLANGWVLVFEGDRYYTSTFSISITGSNGDKFEIWILMKAFEDLRKIEYGLPTIKNQIKFLTEEFSTISSDPGFYKKTYNKVNSEE